MSSQIREQCTRCAIKHLGQARALMLETKKGYPHHVWYAMGHMAEAEDEIAEIQPEEAEAIRAARIRIQDSLAEGDPDKVFMPAFKGLMYTVARGGMLEETL